MKRVWKMFLMLWKKSHPAGVRGLKLHNGKHRQGRHLVAPRRGAWIETCVHGKRLHAFWCRTPQGCVD